MDEEERVWTECSGLIFPQISISWFLLILMAFKIVLGPLTNLSFDTFDIIRLNVPPRIFAEGIFLGLSFLLNIYLFAGMQEGEATPDILTLAMVAFFLSLFAVALHVWQIITLDESRTSVTRPTSSLHTDTLRPPTTLAKTWRAGFLLAACVSPAFFVNYSIEGDDLSYVMAVAFVTTSGGAIVLYYFSSLTSQDPSFVHNCNLAVVGIWLVTIQISVSVGQTYTDPKGHGSLVVWILISSIIWLTAPLLYLFRRMRGILIQLPQQDVATFLSNIILAAGISSVASMIYFSLDTLKCARKVEQGDDAYRQCSAVFLPQFSICFFLFITMMVKLFIAPLSVTTISAQDIIKLNLPRRVVLQGILTSTSFLLNLYLFVNMDDGNAPMTTVYLVTLAVSFVFVPYAMEMARMIRYKSHKGSLADQAGLPKDPAPASPSEMPSSLAMIWRIAFLIVASPTPIFSIIYGLKGNNWYFLMGGASFTTSAGAIFLYYFASLDRRTNQERRILGREYRAPLILGLWLLSWEISLAVGHLHTDPYGRPFFGWFCVSMIIWFNPPMLYFYNKLRNILSELRPQDISSFLSDNLIKVGISSLTPILYLSMDTLKCVRKADRNLSAVDQCSAIYLPQISICIFLVIMMAVKVLITPLSDASITTNGLISLNVHRRHILQGTFTSLSSILNLYLFAGMKEGNASTNTVIIVFLAVFLAFGPPTLELGFMTFFRKSDPESEHAHSRGSTHSPSISMSFSVSSGDVLTRDPSDGGVIGAFI